jgi:O-antigen ligase
MKNRLYICVFILDLIIVGAIFGVEKVKERIQETSLASESRDEVVQDSWPVLKAHWLTGTGAGSFAITFVRYQSPGNLYFDHAHNDYVEWLADHGWGGAVLIVALVLSSLLACVHVLRHRRSRSMRGVALGVVMACLCLAIHSTVDFNLQLPANALTLVFVLALGWAAKLAPSIQSQ